MLCCWIKQKGKKSVVILKHFVYICDHVTTFRMYSIETFNDFKEVLKTLACHDDNAMFL